MNKSLNKTSTSISLGVIGGSGAYHLLTGGMLGENIDTVTLETPFGKSAPIHHFRAGNLQYLFLSRHGEKNYSITAPFVNYLSNIYALKECGVERIISWSGPGIINTSFKPGEYALPDDVIDETKNRQATFFKNRGIGFIRQNQPFCSQVQQAIHDSMHSIGLSYHEKAVYVCTEGPRLETPAEIKKFRINGGDLVGMTLVPELFLARELEMCYAAICYLTNFAEGTVTRQFKSGELFEGMQTNEEKAQVETSIARFPGILAGTFLKLTKTERTCHCKDAMNRYKKKGIISDDWHEWINPI